MADTCRVSLTSNWEFFSFRGGTWRAAARTRVGPRQRRRAGLSRMMRAKGADAMRVLLVHPSPLMYSELYLRLEPLGLERVAAAVRAAGHEVRLLDLQIFKASDYFAELDSFKPAAVGFSLNYLANVPQVLDLAKETRRRSPRCFLFAGGHSVSFIAPEVLDHAAGALDCVVRGEGEVITPRLLEAIGDRRLEDLPGVVTRHGAGPPPTLLENLDAFPPARDLARHRRRY